MNTSKNKLSQADLIQIIQTGSRIVNSVSVNYIVEGRLLISDFEFVEGLVISQSLANNNRPIIFEKCIFVTTFVFENFSNVSSLSFKDCEFKNPLIVRNLTRDLEIIDNCRFRSNCQIFANHKNTLIISNSFFENTLLISGEYHTLKMNELNIKSNSLSNTPDLHFKEFKAELSTFERIHFSRISFSDNCYLWSEGNFKSIDCDELGINHTFIGLLVHFMGCNIRSFIIDNIKDEGKSKLHRYLKFSSQCNIGQASIALHMLDNIEVEHSSFQQIRLWGTNSTSSAVKITDCNLDKFLLIDVTNKGSIEMRQITLKPTQIIGFINSDLGEMGFIKCDFSHGILEFQNSKVMKTFLAETDFPRRVTTEHQQNNAQAELAFGQLQTAFQKQGDSIRSLEYHSREIEAHFNNIKLLSKDFLTTINLGLNLISNYFGRWWGLGIIFTFGFGFIAFLLLLLTTDGFHLTFDRGIHAQYADSFWKFMNPLRHFETEDLFKKHEEIKPTTWSYFLDFLGRVIVTFGYYQTIQAFRKYGRK